MESYTRRDFIKIGAAGAASLAAYGLMPPRKVHAVAVADDLAYLGFAIAALGLAFGLSFRGNYPRADLGGAFSRYVSNNVDAIVDSAGAAASAAHAAIEPAVLRDYAANGELVSILGNLAKDAALADARMSLALYDGLDTVGFGLRAAFAGFMNALTAAPAATLAGTTVPWSLVTDASLDAWPSLISTYTFLTANQMIVASAVPAGCTFAYCIHQPFSSTRNMLYVIAGAAVTAFTRTDAQSSYSIYRITVSGPTVGTWQYDTNSQSQSVSWTNVQTASDPSNVSSWPTASIDVWIWNSAASLVTSALIGACTGLDLPFGADVRPEAVLDPPMPWDAPLLGVDWEDVLGNIGNVGTLGLPDVLTPGLDIPFPGIDAIDWPWEKALFGEQVGIIEGIDSIPWPWAIDDVQVKVGTIDGVRSMPLERTITGDVATSITKELTWPDGFFPFNPPSVESSPPWGDLARFPFPTIFPFNMTYSFLEWLGGVFS